MKTIEVARRKERGVSLVVSIITVRAKPPEDASSALPSLALLES
jgi:hypothetical protein